MDATPPAVSPLRERFPGYLAAFALGLGAGGLIGGVIWLATSARITDAVGYTYSALGALLLLVGGVRGSGYGNPVGGVGEAFAGRGSRRGEPAGDGAPARGRPPWERDPVGRRRRRLSAEPNHTAFWQVVAGFAYLGVGVALTVVFAVPAG